MQRRSSKKVSVPRVLTCQPLEERRVLAASLGWDGPGTGSAELTYYIANTPSSLSSAQTTAAIETALAAWSSAADITFTPTDQPGLQDSIDISFVRIDGAGGTLAQAYFPDDVNPARLAGNVQFDSAEAWEVGNAQGNQAFDLVWVAVHEIGHSLGLDHLGTTAASVLAPFVSPNQAFVNLDSVDVAAIQQLYAATDAMLSGSSPTTVEAGGATAAASGIDSAEPEVDPTDLETDDEVDCHRSSDEGNQSLLGLLRSSPQQLLTRFDTDLDGSLVEDEVPDRLWNNFGEQNVDSDGDGLITLAELESQAQAARAAYFSAQDLDQDGLLVEAELSARLWTKLSAADSDDDAAISLAEFEGWLVEQQANPTTWEVPDGLRANHHHRRVDAVFAQFASRTHRR